MSKAPPGDSKKSDKKIKLQLEQFDRYFIAQYGQERWLNSLKPALQLPTRHCCLINKFADSQMIAECLQSKDGAEYRQVPSISIPCLERVDIRQSEEDNMPFPRPIRDYSNLKTYYLLDMASVMLTEALDIQPGQNVLDMCAAPGGKSLTLCYRLFERSERDGSARGSLTCNEFSPDRKKRLQAVLEEYLPASLYSSGHGDAAESPVRVTSIDGCRFSSMTSLVFDRILLDAPCSSERHLIHRFHAQSHAQELDWHMSKSKQMAKKQLSLLRECFKLLSPNGGRLIYATCSLSHEENDAVVEAAMADASGDFKCLSRKWHRLFERQGRLRFPVGRPTRYGWLVLPDDTSSTSGDKGGWGPLYFALILRGE